MPMGLPSILLWVILFFIIIITFVPGQAEASPCPARTMQVKSASVKQRLGSRQVEGVLPAAQCQSHTPVQNAGLPNTYNIHS